MNQIQETHSRPAIAPYRPAIRKASKKSAKLMRRMKKAVIEGNSHKAKQLLNIYLNSRDAKIVATQQANKNVDPAVRRADRDLIGLAEELDVRVPSNEPVEVYGKRKPDGSSTRIIHSFGLKNRAKQVLVKSAITPFCEPDQRTFLHRGRDTLVKQFLSLIEKEDWRWIVELDIQDFYPSINREILAEALPIEREIFDTVITCERSTRLMRNNRSSRRALRSYSEITAFEGLPQGAITSSLAADMYVTQMLGDLPEGFSVINYGDNFFLGAKTKRELIQKIETLEEAIGLGSRWRLSIVRRQRLRRIDWGFSCLGYQIKIKKTGLSIKPTQKNAYKFMQKVLMLTNHPTARRSAFRFLSYVKSWKASFALYEQCDDFCFRWIDIITRQHPDCLAVTDRTSTYLKEEIRKRMVLELQKPSKVV